MSRSEGVDLSYIVHIRVVARYLIAPSPDNPYSRLYYYTYR